MLYSYNLDRKYHTGKRKYFKYYRNWLNGNKCYFQCYHEGIKIDKFAIKLLVMWRIITQINYDML